MTELFTNQISQVPCYFPSIVVGTLLSKTLYLYSSSYLPNIQYLSPHFTSHCTL